jgi:hypothetical protein
MRILADGDARESLSNVEADHNEILLKLCVLAATVRKTIVGTPPARAKLLSQINGAKNELSV